MRPVPPPVLQATQQPAASSRVSAAGDDFVLFATTIWPRLVRAAQLAGCTPEEAEDMAQTVLERACSRWTRIRAANHPDSYAFTMLFNTVRKARKRHWWGEIPSADPSHHARPESGAFTHDPSSKIDIGRALALLPHHQRAVLILRFLDDQSEQQVAELLGLPIGTVKSRCARGLSQLRELLSATDHHSADHRGTAQESRRP